MKQQLLFDHQVQEICESLVLSQEVLHEVCDRMEEEINKGLGKDTNPDASVKCFPTYVRDLPNGKGKCSHLPISHFHIFVA